MTNRVCRSVLGLLAIISFLSVEAIADTFEFLTYTPPPGWTKIAAKDGITYRRANGIGLIYIYTSYPSTGSPNDEFAKIWRTRVGPTIPGPAPQPQIQRDGDHVAAVGSKRLDAQGTITTVSLVTVVGRGRAIGVLAITAGDDVLREVTAFLDSVNITPGAPGGTTTGSAPAAAGEIAVDFDVPPGYVAERDGGTVVLKPATLDRTTPCIYGISPSRPSRGSLEADAKAAILEPLPGWQIKSDHYNAMRGTSGAGWPYYWFRTDVQRLVGSSYQYFTAMTLAFPSGQGSVNIVWGFGSTGACTLDDLPYLRLFYSLRPGGRTPDGGRALALELQGTWRDTQAVGMAQCKFLPNGRYAYGLGTSTTFGNLETRTGSVGEGRYLLRDAELTITPDVRGRAAAKYRVRIYDEFLGGVWRRTMSLLNASLNPPSEVHYMRIDDSR